MKLKVVIVAISVLALSFMPALTVRAAVRTIWMSPGGTGSGLTPQSPAGSLRQALATLESAAPSGPATVWMKPGKYRTTGTVLWTVPRVTFKPTGYVSGGWPAVARLGGYPVIDGACDPHGLYVLSIRAPSVAFIYIQFADRRAGLVQLYGPSSSGAYFYGASFTRAGTAYCPGSTPGWGGLLPYHYSQGWRVINSHFVDLIDTGPSAGLIHVIYARDHASNGLVEYNAFVNVAGDAIRVRDGSSYNRVTGNTFIHAGADGYIGDWHAPTEAKSYGNVGSGNHWRGYYLPSRISRPDFCYDQYPTYACPANRMLITGG